jgi:REP element-mobilizing transposase RayT
MANSYISCYVHYIFSAKQRQHLITPEIRPRLWAYLGGIARENKMKAVAVGGTDDHVHILLSLPATITLAKAVQLIKGGSSLWIHETFPNQRNFAWQEGYGAFTVSVSQWTKPSPTSTTRKHTIERKPFRRSIWIFSRSTAWNTTNGTCGIKSSGSGLLWQFPFSYFNSLVNLSF